jgi:hypothetical protein
MPDEPQKLNREQEFESFKDSLRGWFLADRFLGTLPHEDFRELLGEIILICEEVLDAEETNATDAVDDPEAYIKRLLFGELEQKPDQK